jgi:HD-GYP domain-containing protein (c-di-GMP phosphodiesterase class II)
MTECSNLQESSIELVELRTGQEISEQFNLVMDFEIMKSHLLSVYDGRIKRWLQAMDIYDKGITGHTLRVTAISLELGRALGLNKEQLVYIQYGTLLHDIGKLGIPDAIIQKPGKLTREEYQVVQKHPIYAYEWLSKRDDFQPAKVIPHFHHERWDGKGYPRQLKGKEIPLLARVVAVVDVWDALTSDRPYRRAMSNKQAIDLITSESGTHFDPDIVNAFLKLGVAKTQMAPYSLSLI